jgi:hypothetical protein
MRFSGLMQRLSNMYVGSVISHLTTDIEAGLLEPICAITYMLYDETPLPMSIRSKKGPSADWKKSQRQRAGRLEKQLLKIVQSEAQIVFCVRAVSDGEHFSVSCPLVCQLRAVDTATGETIHQC